MSADAALGSSHMADRSAEIAQATCDAGKFILGRVGGAVAKAHNAAKTDLAQRGKAGYRPRCKRAARIAGPPMYQRGEFS